LYQPHTFSEAEEIMEALVTIKPTMVVVDSITSMFPTSFLDRGVENIQPGVQARMTQAFLGKYRNQLRQTTVWWINQVRTKIRMMGPSTEEAAGGLGMQHGMDIRLFMRQKKRLIRSAILMKGKDKLPYGSLVDIWSTKTRWSRPFVKIPMYVVFGKGVSNIMSYIDFLTDSGVIEQAKAFYTYRLNGVEEKVKGVSALQSLIKDHMDDVLSYIDSQGGFTLIREESDDTESEE
jgi:RecA/RadA recombinase